MVIVNFQPLGDACLVDIEILGHCKALVSGVLPGLVYHLLQTAVFLDAVGQGRICFFPEAVFPVPQPYLLLTVHGVEPGQHTDSRRAGVLTVQHGPELGKLLVQVTVLHKALGGDLEKLRVVLGGLGLLNSSRQGVVLHFVALVNNGPVDVKAFPVPGGHGQLKDFRIVGQVQQVGLRPAAVQVPGVHQLAHGVDGVIGQGALPVIIGGRHQVAAVGPGEEFRQADAGTGFCFGVLPGNQHENVLETVNPETTVPALFGHFEGIGRLNECLLPEHQHHGLVVVRRFCQPDAVLHEIHAQEGGVPVVGKTVVLQLGIQVAKFLPKLLAYDKFAAFTAGLVFQQETVVRRPDGPLSDQHFWPPSLSPRCAAGFLPCYHPPQSPGPECG